MGTEKKILLEYAMVEDAKKRAEQIGIEFSDILKRVGINGQNLSGYRRGYTAWAKNHGYDDSANIAIMDEDKYKAFCMAFMLQEDKYIVKDPPKAPETKDRPEQTVSPVISENNDELMACIEALTKQLRANTVEMTNVKDQIRNFQTRSPESVQAQAVDDINMKLITTNRALDAIDNKLMTIIGEQQKTGSKVDRVVKAGTESSNSLKTVTEGVSKILAKVVKICSLYEPRR